MSVLLAAAMTADSHSLRLDCLLEQDEDGGSAQIYIDLSGKKRGRWSSVKFEDPHNLLGDDYGSKSANERKWRIKSDKNGSIRLRSISRRTGHSAEINLWASGNQFTGRYWVNQGMLSESFSFGSQGEITCTPLAAPVRNV